MTELHAVDLVPGSGTGCLPAVPKVVVLHPGDVVLAFAGDRMETLLGSCVAVILTDPRRTVAVMCHIVHSMDPPRGRGNDAHFAAPAMDVTFALLRSVGIVPALCHAYLYGGGNMFPDQFSSRHVGAENVSWARECLVRLGVYVCGESVGGTSYRKIGWTVGIGDPHVTSVPIEPNAEGASQSSSG